MRMSDTMPIGSREPVRRGKWPWVAIVLLVFGVCELNRRFLWANGFTEGDRALLDALARREALRRELEAAPWRFVGPGKGSASTFDEGFFDTYTQVRKYPVRNSSEFDVAALEGEITMYRSDGTILATVPVHFEEGIRAGEDRELSVRSETVKGQATKFSLRVTRVRLWKG